MASKATHGSYSADEIKALLKSEGETADFARLSELITRYLSDESGAAAYSLLERIVGKAGDRLELPSRRLALLSSFTLEPVLPYLRVQLFLAGYRLQHLAIAYQQWQAELAEVGALDSFAATDVLLLLHADDSLPLTATSFLATSGDQLRVENAELLSLIENGLAAFRRRSSAQLVVGTIPSMTAPLERFSAAATAANRRHVLEEFNRQLATISRTISGCRLYPYSEMIEEFGRARYFDLIKNNLNQTAIQSMAYPALAADLARFFRNSWTPRHKVVALDLDNTLWGGIVGEDGLQGIKLGREGVGKSFRDWQIFLRELHASGILLVLNSKNNVDDVREVFTHHPDCVLSWEDFAAVRVNWSDKAGNLRELADELGLGLSSFVFVDDNPMELDRVRSELPEVTTVACVGAIEQMPAKLLAAANLEPLLLGADDASRNASYRAERVRKETQSQFGSYDEFLSSLQLRLRIDRASDADIARLSQLAGKTNQFNTTTLRWSEQQLEKMLHDPAYDVLTMSLADKYGDYGTIGLVVLREHDRRLHIDTYLMSCRILGRKVEDSVFAFLQQRALERGAQGLIGYFKPTAKNKQVADLFARFGFGAAGEAAFETLFAPNDRAEAWTWETQTQAPRPFPNTLEIMTNVLRRRSDEPNP